MVFVHDSFAGRGLLLLVIIQELGFQQETNVEIFVGGIILASIFTFNRLLAGRFLHPFARMGSKFQNLPLWLYFHCLRGQGHSNDFPPFS